MNQLAQKITSVSAVVVMVAVLFAGVATSDVSDATLVSIGMAQSNYVSAPSDLYPGDEVYWEHVRPSSSYTFSRSATVYSVDSDTSMDTSSTLDASYYTVTFGVADRGSSTGTVHLYTSESIPSGMYRFDTYWKSGSDVTTYGFYFTVVSLGTMTQVSADHFYVVEGETVSFTVTGSCDNGTTYSATASTDGGELSKTSGISSGDTVTFTAPQVNGTTTYTVTVTSDVSGHTQSSATVSIIVKDALVLGTPSAGEPRSS